MKVTSISRNLLSRVLSLYFVLTFIVTCVQIGAEYVNTKSHINSELITLEKTFGGSLTRAVWELNTPQAIVISEGLLAIPMIKGITLTDENSEIITQLGQSIDGSNAPIESSNNPTTSTNISSLSSGLFGHTFPLIFEFSGRTTKVGTVTILSSNEVIFNRIEVGIYFLIANAMVKTAALVLLFSIAFSKLLTTPLNNLTDQIGHFDIDDPESSKLHMVSYEQNELSVLQNTYNNLIDQLVQYKNQLSNAQEEILSTNNKLDEQNIMLEQEVAKKTSSLSQTMLKMEVQQRELIEKQGQLEKENKRRSRTEETLTKTNQELKSSISELNRAQERLMGAEKMANLGELSAEVTHEVNTPIGVSITSTSYLADLLAQLKYDKENQKLSKRSLDEFIENAQRSTTLLESNLNRASDLISSYKQIAVDQISDKIRLVNFAKYLDEIIHSLHPKLKKNSHTIKVNCPTNIEIYCHAGAIAQIFTNLIINSVTHAFENKKRGQIFINILMIDDLLTITYFDDGDGIPESDLPQLFTPFFTTKLNAGGTGLGTHVIHSLVTDTLNGTIKATSPVDSGLKYTISFKNMR